MYVLEPQLQVRGQSQPDRLLQQILVFQTNASVEYLSIQLIQLFFFFFLQKLLIHTEGKVLTAFLSQGLDFWHNANKSLSKTPHIFIIDLPVFSLPV